MKLWQWSALPPQTIASPHLFEKQKEDDYSASHLLELDEDAFAEKKEEVDQLSPAPSYRNAQDEYWEIGTSSEEGR